MMESDGRLKGVFPKQSYALKGHLTSKTNWLEPRGQKQTVEDPKENL